MGIFTANRICAFGDHIITTGDIISGQAWFGLTVGDGVVHNNSAIDNVTKLVTMTKFVSCYRFEVKLRAGGITGGIVPIGGIGRFQSETDIQFVNKPLKIWVKATTPETEALC